MCEVDRYDLPITTLTDCCDGPQYMTHLLAGCLPDISFLSLMARA